MSEGRSPAGIETVIADPRWSDSKIHWQNLADQTYQTVMQVTPDAREGAVALLLCDDPEMRKLNAAWRGKDSATNVLSFPSPEGAATLGDLALAYDTLAQEAAASGKRLEDHASHLITHGLLHLLGYDHKTDTDAETMEALEIDILNRLGVANPYREAAR